MSNQVTLGNPAIEVANGITLQHLSGMPYPIEVTLPPAVTDGIATVRVCLSAEEANALQAELLQMVTTIEEESRSYVQIRFHPGGGAYTYADPSGTLDVGDEVLVPVTYTDELQQAYVSALGRGSYEGPVKSVRARVL